MTNEEIDRWQKAFNEGGHAQQWMIDLMDLKIPEYPNQPIQPKHYEIDGVHIRYSRPSITWSVGNGRGLVFADSFFNGPNDHEPALRISPLFSDECRFRPLVRVSLEAIAAGARQAWNDFRG